MIKKMLIDATHSEETRVAVIEGDRLEEYEYESQSRKPIKGSVFLAKVTRVEPSLQAAFVNFGGNRHGFLPFSEIHPDYFRIPISDREALMAEQEELLEQAQKSEEEALAKEEDNQDSQEEAAEDKDSEEDSDDLENGQEDDQDEDDANGNVADESDQDDERDEKASSQNRGRGRHGGRGRGRRPSAHRSRRDEKYDSPEDAERRFRFNLRRKYKIQEVIKRGQIMLVQASKEERGNKGAAVGTYLSLPGRYCVLMPNSPRAGGVSRKIANYKDRNRMRDIMKDLEVPKGMSVILRTAGLSRTKTEIKRDLDYLIKLWNNIRERTLESSAPSLVYEEANLIKRAVRDMYTRDVEEIQIAGSEGFKTAKNFMKMMIPSHVKKVKEYSGEDSPLFKKYGVERQITEIGETQVTLPSGGYLVINPTEALVSIDVNSGRSTKERHIEETALKTNLETATEVARQLRLRDLGGLVVIDFIDMENRRNNGKVERRMRDALAGDRARVQVGRISSFGLMEMSRQRLNPSLTEAQFKMCDHCAGTGNVRTADASAIMVLRAIEDEGMKARAAQGIAHVSSDVALYILNNKRKEVSSLEERYEFQIIIRVDNAVSASSFRVEVSKPSDGASSGDKPAKNSDDDARSGNNRRRGRRGGRRVNNQRDQGQEEQGESNNEKPAEPVKTQEKTPEKSTVAEEKAEKPKRGRKPAAKKEDVPEEKEAPKAEKPKRGRKPAVKKETATEEKTPVKKEVKSATKKEPTKAKKTAKKSSPSNDDKSAAAKHEKVNQVSGAKKKGWWNRLGGE